MLARSVIQPKRTARQARRIFLLKQSNRPKGFSRIINKDKLGNKAADLIIDKNR
jgi:hypothetical protein